MAGTTFNNATMARLCKTEKMPVVPLILIFAIFPFHVLMMKILAINLRFTFPRHSILFSLCLSDGFQVFVAMVLGIISACSTISEEGLACMMLTGTVMFTTIVTLFVTCVSIISLSLERYVACIHSFDLHLIFTESRVRKGSIFTWVMATASAVIVLIVSKIWHTEAGIMTSTVTICSVVCIFPSSLIVIIVQGRLYLFSRRKLIEVAPGKAFGAQLELADYRKKHIKVAAVAGMVAFAFVFCMAPYASLSLYALITGAPVSTPARIISSFLMRCNTVLDPVIYGFGMADIRKKIYQDVKKVKEYVMERIISKINKSA